MSGVWGKVKKHLQLVVFLLWTIYKLINNRRFGLDRKREACIIQANQEFGDCWNYISIYASEVFCPEFLLATNSIE